MYLGNFKQNETVTVQVVTTDDGNTYGPSYAEIVQLDMATVRETMQSLAGNALQVKSHSHGKITGSITLADDQQAVMTSIPYDKGWTILVDGKKSTIQHMPIRLCNLNAVRGNTPLNFDMFPQALSSVF